MAVRQIIFAESSTREYRKYAGLLFFIVVVASFMSTLIAFHWVDWLRWFIGSFMLVFGGFKLIGYESFTSVFPDYDYLAHRFGFYNMIYPILEVFLAFCFILDMASGIRNLVTLFIVGIGLISVYKNLQHVGPSRQNTTLGKLFKLPMSSSLLFENALLTLAIILLMVHNLL